MKKTFFRNNDSTDSSMSREWERREGGEWDFKSGSDWVGPSRTIHLPSHSKSKVCDELLIAKIMIIIFTLLNLLMIGAGGVVFTLGLTGYWSDKTKFSHLMVCEPSKH